MQPHKTILLSHSKHTLAIFGRSTDFLHREQCKYEINLFIWWFTPGVCKNIYLYISKEINVFELIFAILHRKKILFSLFFIDKLRRAFKLVANSILMNAFMWSVTEAFQSLMTFKRMSSPVYVLFRIENKGNAINDIESRAITIK